MEKEGYLEAPGAEIHKPSIRKSTRLQTKNKPSSCSQAISKHTIKSSKPSLHEKTPISDNNTHQLSHNNEINGIFSADITSIKSSTLVPSFKYHIGAKDGIRLIVDLNLKRSDWLKSIEKTVCVCRNHSKPEFKSFRQEVECLGGRNNRKISSLVDKTTLSDDSISKSSEIEKTPPSMAEKEVVSVSGSKRSWSKFDQSSEFLEDSSCSERGNSNFDDGVKRKKRDHKSGQIYGQSHERILRSTKLFGGQIFESGGIVVKRSSRLLTK